MYTAKAGNSNQILSWGMKRRFSLSSDKRFNKPCAAPLRYFVSERSRLEHREFPLNVSVYTGTGCSISVSMFARHAGLSM
jgi:hypothetical protein